MEVTVVMDRKTLENFWVFHREDSGITHPEMVIEEDQLKYFAEQNGLELVRKRKRSTDETVWISVEDSLPEPHVDVLVVCDGGTQVMHLVVGTRTFWDVGCGGPNITSSGVTHWMPLSEPPRKEEI